MKKLVSVFLIIIFLFMFSISVFANTNNLIQIYKELNLNQDEINYLKTHRSFRFSSISNYAPIEYIDSMGNPKGFGVEYLKYASNLLGIEFIPVDDFESLSWTECYTKLSNGDIDLLSAITFTEKRRSEVIFTKPYLEQNCSVIGRATSRIILNAKELEDERLVFPSTYWQNDYIRELYPKVSIINTKDIHSALTLIDKGDADYTFIENTVYNYYMQRYHYKNIGIVGELSKKIDQRIGVSKNNALLASILNKVIDYAPKDEIYNKAIYIEFVKRSNSLLTGILILSTVLFIILSYILYKKFKASVNREKHLQETREQLFESLSHDLKNPMCLIKANLDLIKYDIIKQDELKNHLKLIYNNIDTINNIVDDLYELTTFKDSILSKKFVEVKIGEFLEKIYAENKSLFTNTNKELLLVHDKNTYHTSIKIEPISFNRAINNLISNAYKYTENYGKVKIHYYRSKNDIYITIWDNGIGIPKNELNNIFKKFHRVNNFYTENTIGKGIGLSVVYEIIKLHHGTLSVKSIEGLETEFIIKLPKL